jgi:hypothetical protein
MRRENSQLWRTGRNCGKPQNRNGSAQSQLLVAQCVLGPARELGFQGAVWSEGGKLRLFPSCPHGFFCVWSLVPRETFDAGAQGSFHVERPEYLAVRKQSRSRCGVRSRANALCCREAPKAHPMKSRLRPLFAAFPDLNRSSLTPASHRERPSGRPPLRRGPSCPLHGEQRNRTSR